MGELARSAHNLVFEFLQFIEFSLLDFREELHSDRHMHINLLLAFGHLGDLIHGRGELALHVAATLHGALDAVVFDPVLLQGPVDVGAVFADAAPPVLEEDGVGVGAVDFVRLCSLG